MFGMGMGLPPQKAQDFRGSFASAVRPARARNAADRCRDRAWPSSASSSRSSGRRSSATAINSIFDGAIGQQIASRRVRRRIRSIAGLAASGQGQFADMLSTMHVTPGVGIDFGALGGILGLLVGVYVISSIFAWGQAWIMAGVTQRTVLPAAPGRRCKLGRLPLRYFDSHPRGDLLSRVTNDIDNIGQSLQQSLTQLITSLLTDHRRADHDAARSARSSPWSRSSPCRLSLVVTIVIVRRSQTAVRRPVGLDGHPQRPCRGDAHRARDRQGCSAASSEAIERVRRGERAALRSELPGAVHLRDHPAGDELHRRT